MFLEFIQMLKHSKELFSPLYESMRKEEEEL
ncbi:MAG: hypothetical protein QG627_751 [Chlamydiota bacterium]|jgi:hypothetical protein|nr:hypothetical protein [Chlamydiota bacterium]